MSRSNRSVIDSFTHDYYAIFYLKIWWWPVAFNMRLNISRIVWSKSIFLCGRARTCMYDVRAVYLLPVMNTNSEKEIATWQSLQLIRGDGPSVNTLDLTSLRNPASCYSGEYSARYICFRDRTRRKGHSEGISGYYRWRRAGVR